MEKQFMTSSVSNKKSTKPRKPPIIILIVFFPVTIYFILGFTLLLIFSKIEVVLENILNDSIYESLRRFKAREYHKLEISAAVFYPIIVPLIFLRVITYFLGAIFSVILTFVFKSIQNINVEIPKYIISKCILIIFFPLSIYFFLGAALLFLLSTIEEVSEYILENSVFISWRRFVANDDYHEQDAVIVFPISVPIIAIRVIIVFLWAILSFILTLFFNVLNYILKSIWKYMHDIWEYIQKR